MKIPAKLFYLLIAINTLLWLPMLWTNFPMAGNGADTQILYPAINAALRHGNLPWNSMTKIFAAREDIFSNPYFSLLYPFYWTLGFNTVFSYPQQILLDFSATVFHVVLASITFAILVYRMGCRTTIAAISGIFYAYSLHLKMWSSWLWSISGYSWLPLCLLGIWEITFKNNKRQGIICLAIGFGLISLGSSFQLLYAIILSAVFFATSVLYTKPNIKTFLKNGRDSIIGGLLGAIIGSSHLIPVLFRQSTYIRWYQGGTIIGGLKPPYEGTISQSIDFSLTRLTHFLIPYGDRAHKLGHLYVGSAVIFFTAYLICTCKTWRRASIPLLFIALYFLADAMGDNTFIHRITYLIPVINSIRYPIANLIVTIVPLLILAALGTNKMVDAIQEQKPFHKWMYSLALLCAITLLAQYVKRDALQFAYNRDGFFAILLLPFLASLLPLMGRIIPKRFIILSPIIILAAYLPQNSLLVHPKLPHNCRIYLKSKEFNLMYNGLKEAKTNISPLTRLAVDIPYYTFNTKEMSPVLLQSVAMMAGWNVMQIALSPRPYKEYKLMQTLLNRDTFNSKQKLLNAGISHIITSPIVDDDPRKQFYQFVRKIGQFDLYKIPNYEIGQPATGCLKSLNSTTYLVNGNQTRIIKLDTSPKMQDLAICQPAANNTFSTSLTNSQEPNILSYKVESNAPGLLITDQVYSKSWDVHINNTKVQPFQIDGYRLALKIPKGLSIVKLAYKPLDFTIGAILTYLGFLIVGLIIILPSCKTWWLTFNPSRAKLQNHND